MATADKVDASNLRTRLFRLFVVFVSLWIGLVMSFPDALTYYKYAALNGTIVSQYINWHTAYWWIAIGAPSGVYIFAFNNLYRFTVLVLSDIYKVRLCNLAALRYCGFGVILILAAISMVPFYGMAYQAGISMPFVLANSFARFCMNTFAFFFLWNYLVDKFVMYSSRDRAAITEKIDRIMYAMSIGALPRGEIIDSPDDAWVNSMLRKYSLPSFHELPAQGVFLRFVSIASFVIGIIAALYLYNFAFMAAANMGWKQMSSLVAGLGVLPTCLLWGHDARFSWRTPVRFLLRHGVRPENWLQRIYYVKPLKIIFLFVILLLVLFISVPATLSETMMAWHVTHGLMRHLLEWSAGPAFIGIYTTGIIEMLCRIMDWAQRVFYPHSPQTKHLHCLQQLRSLRQACLRARD